MSILNPILPYLIKHDEVSFDVQPDYVLLYDSQIVIGIELDEDDLSTGDLIVPYGNEDCTTLKINSQVVSDIVVYKKVT